MNRGSFIAGGASLALVGGLTASLMVMGGFVPINADTRPGPIETFLAKHALHAALARLAPKTPDPLAPTVPNLLRGISRYKQDCAVCHGLADGKPTVIARGLYQPPPQLAKDGVEDDPPGITFYKIAKGIRMTGMPSFDHTLNDHQIWEVVTFLKTMNHLPPAAESAWKAARPANQAS